MKTNLKAKNPIAKKLKTPQFKLKVVKPKKGKGSYVRSNNNNRNSDVD